MTPAQEWLAMSEEERDVIRNKVAADRVAQGLTPFASDPVRLERTARMIRETNARKQVS